MPSGRIDAHAQKWEFVEQKGIYRRARDDIKRNLGASNRQPTALTWTLPVLPF